MKKRAFLLATTLVMIPVALLLTFTIVRSTLLGAGWSRQEQLRSQTFYLAESGLEVAFHCFASDNFISTTHEPDGSARSSSDIDLLTSAGVPGLALDGDGWYRWEWNPGDNPADSFTRSGRAESYRFQVLFPDSLPAGNYRIVCEATVGNRTAAQQLEGYVDNVFNHVMFDNGELSDFTNSSGQSFVGSIHANGNIYLRPYKTDGLSTLQTVFDDTDPIVQVFTDSMTAGGNIIRHEDVMGIPDDGGSVRVTNSITGASALMEGYDQGASGAGNAYDSLHPDWTDPGPNGAVDRWDTAVADRKLGAETKQVPSRKTFAPGGFYDLRADTHVNASTSTPWAQDVSFYNEAEERLITVKEIDLWAMATAGAWPNNGLLYSEVPVRLVNGARLAGPLTVTTNASVYVKGDFNKEYPDQSSFDTNTDQSQPAAIMTTDRVYRLTSSFQDKPGPDYPGLLDFILGNPMPKASDAQLYTDDPENVLEINAGLVDGVPTVESRSWIDDPSNTFFVPGYGISVSPFISLNRKVKQIPDGSTIKVSFAQAGPYLENLQEVKVTGKGANAHLRIAEMARFDNSDASNDVTPWVVKSFYMPPDDDIDGDGVVDGDGETFNFDPRLAAPQGAMSSAPFAPRAARKVRWVNLSRR